MTTHLTLTGTHALIDGSMAHADVTIADGAFRSGSGGRRLPCDGLLALPGIVDAHGDGFERHLAPRRGAVSDLGAGLGHLEAELAHCGITTATLAQFWSWEGGMRAPAFAARLATALASHDATLDLRLQLRVETSLLADASDILAFIDRSKIRQVVLNDHLPHKALAAGKTPPRLTGQALKSGRSPQAHLDLMQDLHAKRSQTDAALPGFIEALTARRIGVGTHDDASAETRLEMHRLGATLAEFPETEDAAHAAREAGGTVVLGAPNVTRGGSHNRNISAQEMIRLGLCDALASDYHYPAPLQAAFALADRGVAGFEATWALVSEGPARVLGLHDRGRIADGLRADLVLVDPATRRVEATFAAGRPVWLGPRLARAALG